LAFQYKRWRIRFLVPLVAISVHWTFVAISLTAGWTWYPNTKVHDNLAVRSGIYELHSWTRIDHFVAVFLSWVLLLVIGCLEWQRPLLLARRFREITTLWFATGVLIYTLPIPMLLATIDKNLVFYKPTSTAEHSSHLVQHLSNNPTLRDASCETREIATANFSSTWALQLAPILVIINALPFLFPTLLTISVIVLGWLRARSLFSFTFGLNYPVPVTSTFGIFLACLLMSCISDDGRRNIFTVATIGARRVRQYHNQNEHLQAELQRAAVERSAWYVPEAPQALAQVELAALSRKPIASEGGAAAARTRSLSF